MISHAPWWMGLSSQCLWLWQCDSERHLATITPWHHDRCHDDMMTWWHVTAAQSTLYSRPHPHPTLSSHLKCCARGANYDIAPALGGVAQSIIWSTLSLSFVACFHCLWTAVSCLVSPVAWRPSLASAPSAPPSLVWGAAAKWNINLFLCGGVGLI